MEAFFFLVGLLAGFNVLAFWAGITFMIIQVALCGLLAFFLTLALMLYKGV